MDTYILAFVMNELFMLISSLALLKKTQYYFDSEGSVRRFKKLVLAICIYLLCDIFWAILFFSNMHTPLLLIHLLSIANFSFYAIIPYFWFNFVEENLKTDHFTAREFHYASLAILIIFIADVATSFKTGYIYTLDDSHNMIWNPYTTTIIFVILAIFLGGATLHGLIVFLTTKSPLMKKKSLRVVIFIIPILLGLFLYQKFMIAICIPPAIFTSILLYFLTLEDQMSYIDHLTGLYNRKKLLELEDELKATDLQKIPLTLYYIDINEFKKINTTHGHMEGDKVISYIGEALKSLESKYEAISIRLGRDEFILLLKSNTIRDVDFDAIINDEIDRILSEKNLPEKVSVSIGHTYCDDPAIPLNHYIQVANQTMYIEKHLI